MPRTALVASLLALSCLAASGYASASAAPVSAVRIPPAAAARVAPPITRDRALVRAWVREMDAIYTLSFDAAGNEVGRAEGIVLSTKAGVARVVKERVPVATERCEEFDDQGDPLPREQWGPAGPGEGTRLTLVLPGNRKVILADPEPMEGANELDHVADVVASIGPYLFVRQSTYSYACGAHGATSAEAAVFDVERGEPIELGPSAAEAIELKKRAAKAFAVDADGDETTPDDEVGITEARVDWTGGRLGFAYQLTTSTCFACGDGAWSSYTKSVALDAPSLPPALAGHREVPAPVKRWLAAHPGVTLGGFTSSP